MQGPVVKVAVEGDVVLSGQLLVVMEAMKMENPVTAHRNGTVTALSVEVGHSLPGGAVLCRIVGDADIGGGVDDPAGPR